MVIDCLINYIKIKFKFFIFIKFIANKLMKTFKPPTFDIINLNHGKII